MLLDDLQQELRVLEQQALRRQLRTVRGTSGRLVEIDGRTVINFSSNNYLGLANHEALILAATSALRDAGVGSTASRLIIGNHQWHRTLEQTLASFHEREAALLFNSGYNANIGALQTLTTDDDVIFSDALNHASIIDGCRLSKARVVPYPHGDLRTLSSLLEQPVAGRRLIVTETVFSMDGDLARVTRLQQLCERHGAVLMVDEAHAVGVLGPRGRGVCAGAGVQPDILVGTLGKSLGSFGAYITGCSELVELLLNRDRSFVFTTALPPSIAAASHAAVELVGSVRGDSLRMALQQSIEQFRLGLLELGLLAPGAGQSPIFPIVVGEESRVMQCTEILLGQSGIYAQGIRPPTVPPGTARLRFSLMATHMSDDIELALGGLRDLKDAGLLTAGPGADP